MITACLCSIDLEAAGAGSDEDFDIHEKTDCCRHPRRDVLAGRVRRGLRRPRRHAGPRRRHILRRHQLPGPTDAPDSGSAPDPASSTDSG
ncbi:MAG: hypothetical protein LBQ06_07680, partial [Frankiaceae bacterium]|nr:hypothetical protein [Frankiaceae bacterium]